MTALNRMNDDELLLYQNNSSSSFLYAFVCEQDRGLFSICLPQLQALFFWQEHLVISFHAESLVPGVDVR